MLTNSQALLSNLIFKKPLYAFSIFNDKFIPWASKNSRYKLDKSKLKLTHLSQSSHTQVLFSLVLVLPRQQPRLVVYAPPATAISTFHP